MKKLLIIFLIAIFISLSSIFKLSAQQNSVDLSKVISFINIEKESEVHTYLRSKGYRFSEVERNNPCYIYKKDEPKYFYEFEFCVKDRKTVYLSYNVPYTSIENIRKELKSLLFEKVETIQETGKLPSQLYLNSLKKLKCLLEWDEKTNHLFLNIVEDK